MIHVHVGQVRNLKIVMVARKSLNDRQSELQVFRGPRCFENNPLRVALGY
jgi:hypothetical protein